MVDQERWVEIRRLFLEERVSISEIGRRLDVDRKTVRRSLRQATWQPYHRAVMTDTLLSAHADFVRDRAPQVNYSARILYQELRARRGYTGSYETVKRCVAPLREVQMQAERARLRFETPPEINRMTEPMYGEIADFFTGILTRKAAYEKAGK